MRSEHSRDAKVDDLLRRALPDDLPADVAAGMRERISRLRAVHEGARTPADGWTWLRQRAVWAALSVLMLAAGILLQGAAASSPLADRISAIKTSSSDPGRIGR